MFLCAYGEHFCQVDRDDIVERPSWFFEILIESQTQNFVDFEEFGVRSDIAELMVNIQMISWKKPDAASCVTASHYQEMLTFLTMTIQKILNTPIPQLETSAEDALNAACCHALLVHTLAQWRGQQPDPSLTISHALHELLKALRVLLVLNSNNALVLWLLSVAASSTSFYCQVKYKWCVDQLADVTTQMEIRSWDAMRATLEQVIWNTVQDEVHHQLVWEDVIVRRQEEESE